MSMRRGRQVFRRFLSLQVIKYGFVGGFGTVLHMLVLYVLVSQAGMNPVAASTIGFIIVLIVSYLLNRFWTFQVPGAGDTVRFLKYTVVSTSGLLLNSAIVYVTVEKLHWHYLVGQASIVAVIPAFNFVLNRYWTFKKGIVDKTDPASRQLIRH